MTPIPSSLARVAIEVAINGVCIFVYGVLIAIAVTTMVSIGALLIFDIGTLFGFNNNIVRPAYFFMIDNFGWLTAGGAGLSGAMLLQQHVGRYRFVPRWLRMAAQDSHTDANRH